jgi:holo-[acyl-carrier protein] synthase
MIYGIGTDIVAVKRLRGMWERHGDKALENCWRPEIADFAAAPTRALSGQALCRQGSLRQGAGHRRRPPALLCRRLAWRTTNWASHL